MLVVWFLFLFAIESCRSYLLVYPFQLQRTQTTCPVDKPGTSKGEATMFQEDWVHGKTGACGFNRPNTGIAEGMFAAVGSSDWDTGYGCGTCAEVSYKGRTVTVNVVDRCWGCSKGWFDLGGPAWTKLTGGEPPGHIYGVKSRWVECPAELTGGENMHIYVKPGSHPWDARFQPIGNVAPVTGMSIHLGKGWKKMRKCENYMFCKPAGPTISGRYKLRVSSANGNVDVEVTGIPEGQYINTGSNNAALSCNGQAKPTNPTDAVNPPAPQIIGDPCSPSPCGTNAVCSTTSSSSASCSCVSGHSGDPYSHCTPSGPGGCERDGLFPDPGDCRAFIKCAQGDPYKLTCGGGLYFDLVTYNCNWPAATACGTRPVPGY